MWTEAIAAIVAQLTEAGISAAADPRDLSLPGCWVTPDTADVDALDVDRATVTVAVVAVAGSSAQPTALEQLDTIMAGARDVLGPGTWTAAAIRLPNHAPDPLPAASRSVVMDWSSS